LASTPLSPEIVRDGELCKHTGNQQYVFPNQHNLLTFISENTRLYALYRMGYHSRTTGRGLPSSLPLLALQEITKRRKAQKHPNT
jgi:hypothetical protein